MEEPRGQQPAGHGHTPVAPSAQLADALGDGGPAGGDEPQCHGGLHAAGQVVGGAAQLGAGVGVSGSGAGQYEGVAGLVSGLVQAACGDLQRGGVFAQGRGDGGVGAARAGELAGDVGAHVVARGQEGGDQDGRVRLRTASFSFDTGRGSIMTFVRRGGSSGSCECFLRCGSQAEAS